MGEKRNTYSNEFKRKAVDMYLKQGMGYKTIAKELGIRHSMVQLWVRHYRNEGAKGLEEKRGHSPSPMKGRPRTKEQSVEDELHRLRAENEYLKKLWALQRGRGDGESKRTQ